MTPACDNLPVSSRRPAAVGASADGSVKSFSKEEIPSRFPKRTAMCGAGLNLLHAHRDGFVAGATVRAAVGRRSRGLDKRCFDVISDDALGSRTAIRNGRSISLGIAVDTRIANGWVSGSLVNMG